MRPGTSGFAIRDVVGRAFILDPGHEFGRLDPDQPAARWSEDTVPRDYTPTNPVVHRSPREAEELRQSADSSLTMDNSPLNAVRGFPGVSRLFLTTGKAAIRSYLPPIRSTSD
jgi:hypothetical protein